MKMRSPRLREKEKCNPYKKRPIQSLLLHNVRILSPHNDFADTGSDSVFVRDGRIAAVGRRDLLQSMADGQTNQVNGKGKVLLPGFNDSHIHLWKVGHLKSSLLDLRGAGSLDEMLSLLEAWHKANPERPWITARGFNEAAWKNGRFPLASDLDKIIPDKPVYVIRTCAHFAVANTRAMELCGINGETPVPAGGFIEKDSTGKPNGIFADAALALINGQIPAPGKSELKKMLLLAREELYRYGITAATDPAVDPLLLEAYHELNAENGIGFRLNAIPMMMPDGGDEIYPMPEYVSGDYFNVKAVKFFSDGSLSGKTAALKGCYKDSHEKGLLRLSRDRFETLGRAAMEKGFGLATHAIGDAAISYVIGVYKKLLKDQPGRAMRIEHLGLPDSADLEKMAGAGIAASMQTIFLSELGKNFKKYLTAEYLDRCYPVRSVLDAGILTALSSDAPVVKDFNPLKGMEAAVTRRDNEGNEIGAAEAISINEALKGYTSAAADISELNDYGRIKEGFAADFILLNQNPLHTMPSKLTTLHVVATYVAGDCVYASAK